MPTSDTTLLLADIAIARNAVEARYRIADLSFSTAIWYDSVDFDDLRARFGADFVERLGFHIAAFEMNKVASLKPARIDWGKYGHFADADFNRLWASIFENVWAQWRYENRITDYRVPELPEPAAPTAEPVARDLPDDCYLAFCGGGKDSLLTLSLLGELGVSYDSLAYSASFYGTAPKQHALIDRLLDHGAPRRRHKQWVSDQFLDVPVTELRPDFGVEHITAAETPSSIFAALPIVLAHGHRYICLAHERSADTGQVEWNGEDINHQWGKSFAAEALLNGYIRDHLIADFDYFSILKPVYDVTIFAALTGVEDAVPATHSCNISKPWCLACPKCLYVWLGYAAFLDRETMIATFGDVNLLDREENIFTYRQLVGLEDQLPFECIGQAREAALFMRLAERRGWSGCAIEACRDALDVLDLEQVASDYTALDFDCPNIPASIRDGLESLLERSAAIARERIAVLSGSETPAPQSGGVYEPVHARR
ncbi:hypothetical protein [Parasphingopyxis sp.]|uniref:hypothetical protein n=1 Tax=Parasphingopyxis sp. TaxID=1920299 RepID=UPI00262B7967|nr:hypothetical protein [Parasphingopyxis sp.]